MTTHAPACPAFRTGDAIRCTCGAAHRFMPVKQPVKDENGDYVCQHGTAMDVHCCYCHNGFIFDPDHVCAKPLNASATRSADKLTNESPRYSLADRIAQWREQAREGEAALKAALQEDVDKYGRQFGYMEGRVFTFDRCADEAELYLSAALDFEQTRSDGLYTDVERRNIQLSEQAVKIEQLETQLAEAPATDKEWRCFHCDEVFTDEGEAREHFGADMDRVPACRLSVDDVKQLRALEDLYDKLRAEIDLLDNDARLWHEAEADRVRRIGNRQWWQELDSREGEKLALQERVKQLVEYTDHRRGCKVDGNGDPPSPCTCGLDALLGVEALAPSPDTSTQEKP